MVLTVIALLAGAFIMWRQRGPWRRIILMVVLAVVVAINIGMWTLPMASGDSPLAELQKQQGSSAN